MMTEAEYLAFEEAAVTKHEFVDGQVYDWPGYDVDAEGLAGATRAHNQLQVAVLAALAPAARAAGCQAFGSDMRLRVILGRRSSQETHRYYYPDAMVLCDQELRAIEGDDELHVTRPCVIVEILSRRSIRIDRTEKLEISRRLPSVHAYLVVHQQQRRVERQWRDADTWQHEGVTSGSVPIPCIGFDLALDAIYAGLP